MNLGINLSGAEYEVTGNGATDTHFVFPTQAQIDYYGAKGFSQIRLPLSWERLQPTLNGELNQAYVAELRDVVAYAQERGISVIIDVHNYGYYEGNLIGSSAVPVDAFANLWGRIGEEFSDSSNVVFGLMNEPQLATAGDWLVAVNAAIGALRDAGADQQVLVPGTDWDTANRWTENGNADVLGKPGAIIDPVKNFAFEVHQYLDDTSGQNAWVVSETIGVERLKAITEWAQATGNKLYLGEFGVADNPLALAALTKMMDYIAANPDVWEGGSYWAGGHGWTADYMYSAEPDFGLLDAPQMAVLEQYTGVTTTTTTLPDGSVQITTRPEGDHVPSIIDLFDAQGHLTSRTLLDGNDNPVRMIEPGADGSNTVTIYEEPGQQMSVTVEIYDHNNARVSESVTAADGTTVVHQYDPGAHDPKLDTYYGSDGTVLKTVEHAADCVTITTYHGGAVNTVELCDISWQLLSRSTYNADGDLVSRQTDNADGTHSLEQFDAHTGIVTTSAEYSATWHSVSNTNFDSNGHIASVITEMDGGQKRVEVYAPGDSDFTGSHDIVAATTTATALVFLLGQLAFQSSWVNLVPGLFQLTLMITVLAVLLGIMLALLDRKILAAATSIAMLLLIYWQINMFAWVANYPVNVNILFTYVPIAGFALFASSRLNLAWVLRILFLASLAYCLVYIAFYDVLISLSGLGVRTLVSDSARDTRLYMAVGFAAFAFCYALVRVRGEHGVLWLIAALISFVAIYLSFSRLFFVAIVIVGIGYGLGCVRPLRGAVLLIFCLFAAALLAGALFPDWNPYSFAAADDSGAARERAYDIIRGQVSSHFVLGVGIASDPKSEAAFLGEQYVAWDDVGVLGIWYSFGIVGVGAFIAYALACIGGIKANRQVNEPDARALSLCGLVFGILSINSPNIWLGSAAVIVAILIGTKMRSHDDGTAGVHD